MTEYEYALARNRAENGRLVVTLLFAANAIALFAFGGSWPLWGLIAAMISVAIVYLAEAAFPAGASMGATVAAVASAACFILSII